MPFATSAATCQPRRLRPLNSIRHLGRSRVSGSRRDPCPADRMMAFVMLIIDALKPVPPGWKPSDRSGTGGENPFDQRDVGRLVGVDARLGIGHRHDLCLQPKAASGARDALVDGRSEEHTSELQSLMRISYAVFCLK